jgi:hypothetical protein
MNKALTVVEQKEVRFYGDDVMAVRVSDGGIFVPVRPICERLGVTWPSQRNRIMRDAVLAEEVSTLSVFVMNTQGEGGQQRDMLCLPLDYVSGFLFGINADRVSPDIRDKLVRYQRECYKVLSAAFQEGRLTAEPSFDDLLAGASPETIQAYQVAQAVLQVRHHRLQDAARPPRRLGQSFRLSQPQPLIQLGQSQQLLLLLIGQHALAPPGRQFA